MTRPAGAAVKKGLRSSKAAQRLGFPAPRVTGRNLRDFIHELRRTELLRGIGREHEERVHTLRDKWCIWQRFSRWLLFRWLASGEEFADGDEGETAFSAFGEDMRKSLNGASGVRDAVVKNDDRSRSEIFFDEPADVLQRGVRRIVRVGAAQGAGVSAIAGEPELAGTGETSGRTKNFLAIAETQGALDVFEVADKVGVGVKQNQAVAEILVVITDFVAIGFDAGDDFGMTPGAIANKKKRGFRAVEFQNFQNLRGVDGVGAVVEGQGDEGKFGADAIGNLGSEAFEDAHCGERLHEKDDQNDRDQSAQQD